MIKWNKLLKMEEIEKGELRMSKKKNKKSIFNKFMAVIIGAIVISCLTAGYIKTLYDYVIVTIFADNSNIVTDTEEKRMKISPADISEAKTSALAPGEAKIKPSQANPEGAETKVPTIEIGDINTKHRGDSDYIPCNITVKSATYTVEEDGKLVEKEFPAKTGGTIYIKKNGNGNENSGEKKDTKKVPINASTLDENPDTNFFKGLLPYKNQ